MLAISRSIYISLLFFGLMKLSDSMLKQILVYVKGAYIWTDSLVQIHLVYRSSVTKQLNVDVYTVSI